MKTKAKKSVRARSVVLRKVKQRSSSLRQFLPPTSRINFESPTNWRNYREEAKIETEDTQLNP
jgi:hypothetical protein